MITTVTMNPCIDKTLAVEEFDIYKMNRVKVLRTDLSGKGINVSLALNGLKEETFCTGLDFYTQKSMLVPFLNEKGIKSDFVSISGNLRTCTKIFDKTRKTTIEINEYGQEISEKDGQLFINKLTDIANKSDYIVLAGSIPKGLSEDFYGECIKAIRSSASKCKIAVDAENGLLIKSLKYSPYFIKPNIYEFESTFNCKIENEMQLVEKSKKIFDTYNIGLLCVSFGEKGAFISNGQDSFFSDNPKVEIKSIQGAGDSMVAGILLADSKGKALDEIIKYGVTSATSSIKREGTQLCTKEDFDEIYKQNIRIRKIG